MAHSSLLLLFAVSGSNVAVSDLRLWFCHFCTDVIVGGVDLPIFACKNCSALIQSNAMSNRFSKI